MVTKKPPTQDPLGDWGKQQSRLINTSQLHRRTGLDRETIRTRLAAAGVVPRKVLKKETSYDEREALAVLTGPLPAETHKLKTAQAQRISVGTARELLKLQQERGELVPIADVREYAYAYHKAMYGRVTRYARESRQRLKLTPEQAQQMVSDFEIMFDDLKRDHPNIF